MNADVFGCCLLKKKLFGLMRKNFSHTEPTFKCSVTFDSGMVGKKLVKKFYCRPVRSGMEVLYVHFQNWS